MFRTLGTSLTPDSEGAIVAFMIWLFGINWKSSLSGVLSFGIATFGTITSGLAPLAALNPNSALARYSAITTAVLTLLSGLGKVWVGLLQTDAGTQAIKLPNVDEPVAVPSHEVPNQIPPAGAKIVKE
jgi:hypothetical protein